MFETPGQIVPHHIVVNANPRKLKDEIDLEHAEIARAITAGHANRACGLMEDHIRAMVEHYRVEIGDQMHDFIEWR